METKKQKGRPSGSQSFTHVSLKDLNRLFGQDSSIQVGRVWLERIAGVSTPQIQSAQVITQQVQIQAPSTAPVEMQLSE